MIERKERQMKALIILLVVVVLATVSSFVKKGEGNGSESSGDQMCLAKVCRFHDAKERALYGRALSAQECYVVSQKSPDER
jgi:hypothetical protein